MKTYFTETEPSSLLQRFVQPEEVAHAVLMTASNPAVNGASIRVEGGMIQSIWAASVPATRRRVGDNTGA